MKISHLLTILALVSPILPAQSPPPPKPTGTVTGRVYLGDSHLPARMATVTLLPVPPTNRSATTSSSKNSQPSSNASAVETSPDGSLTIKFKPNDPTPTASSIVNVPTLLDGSFTIPNVLPGLYYLIVEKKGYVSPLPFAEFNPSQLSKDEAATLATLLTPLAVAANRITSVDTTLIKGAVISGTVRFDDGAPDSDALLTLMRKDKSGTWAKFSNHPDGWLSDLDSATDDQGHFRLPGLPAGEYLLKTDLVIDGGYISKDGGGSIIRQPYGIAIFYGDGIRQRDAKTIKVGDGEQSDGNNIQIPLAKLHAITGTVISAETGATINSANVELHYADDDTVAATTDTSWDGNEFHFLYVAEGEYTMQVRKAADVLRGPIPDNDKPIRTYADASQSIIVKGDMSGITIQIKPQPVSAAAQ